MTDPIDFPPDPTIGQLYTAPSGAVYSWDGTAWTAGFYNSSTQQLATVGDLISQVRTLLQDVDVDGSSGYRYSTDSLILCLNQGMLDMFRIRPDLFITNGFVAPQYTVEQTSTALIVEQQYVPPLVMYVVGLAQARDDEQNQDARAMGFVKIFQQTIVGGGLL